MNLGTRVKRLLSSQHPTEPGRKLVEEGDRLVVAVSGGPDSLTLLHLFVHDEVHPINNLIVAHLDHALRDSSAEEAANVRERARALGVRSVVERISVRDYASERGLTIEEAGRDARYGFLARVARDEGAAVVATGHTADDQAETVMMNLLRGTGPKGLRGMLPIGFLPGYSDILLARPLLNTTRQEVEAYCQANGLTPIDDKTNLDPAYFRNWIRLELLPMIAERVPGLNDRLNQTADIITADYELLDGILEDTWSFLVRDSDSDWRKLDLSVWRVLPLSLKRSTLRKAVTLIRGDGTDIGFRTIELARRVAETGQVGSESTLPDGVTLTIGYDDLLVTAEGVRAPQVDVPQLVDSSPQKLSIPGQIALSKNWMLRARIVEKVDIEAAKRNPDPLRAFVSLTTTDELVVRPMVQGERFQPLGLGGHSAGVRDVFVNRKIPKASRSLWPVVATPDHIIWLTGHHIDHRVRVKDGGEQVILLTLSR